MFTPNPQQAAFFSDPDCHASLRWLHNEEVSNRGTGRTTALAHLYFRQAFLAPGVSVKVYDHHDTERHHKGLARFILDFVKGRDFAGYWIAVDLHAHTLAALVSSVTKPMTAPREATTYIHTTPATYSSTGVVTVGATISYGATHTFTTIPVSTNFVPFTITHLRSVWRCTLAVMRSLTLQHEGYTVYSSQFDEKTGALVRATRGIPQSWKHERGKLDPKATEEHKLFAKRFSTRFYGGPWSPVPESVDVKLTSKCNFGGEDGPCGEYCYMQSEKRGTHAPKELIEQVILGFDQPPYSLAYGGGEPTHHPDFPWILRRTKELGSVPNYTTNGSYLPPGVIEATNEVVGGVSMTYHPKTGRGWFEKRYDELNKALSPRVQLNIQVIVDKDIEQTLSDVKRLDPFGTRKLPDNRRSLVLLAYYPDVGRASLERLILRQTYQRRLPAILQDLRGNGWRVAFSEGLLPYFLSRPEIGVDTRMARRMEGFFTCYVDDAGRMSKSSFAPPQEDAPTVYDTMAQDLWDGLHAWGTTPDGEACESCPHQNRCSTPTTYNYSLCSYAPHNRT